MPAEDEFRKVAEDVRELARTLRQELRAAQRDARGAARQARHDFKNEYHSFKHQGTWPRPPQRPGWYAGWTEPLSAPPQSDDRVAPPTDAPTDGRVGPPRGRSRAAVYAPPRPPRPPRPHAPPRVHQPRPARPPRPPIRHKHDGSTLFALLAVLVGLAWLAAQTHVWQISAEAVLAVALAVLGAGMVVTARTDWSLSRRHWPWWLGIALLVILLGNSVKVADGLSSLNFGPVSLQPTTWANTGTHINNFAGPIDLDLTHISGPLPADDTIIVRDTFGPVTVKLPPNPTYHVHVIARTVFGPAQVPNQGGSSNGEHVADINPTGTPTLNLQVRTVFGPVTVSNTLTSSPTPSLPTEPTEPPKP